MNGELRGTVKSINRDPTGWGARWGPDKIRELVGETIPSPRERKHLVAAGLLSLFPDYITESHHRTDGIDGFSAKTKSLMQKQNLLLSPSRSD